MWRGLVYMIFERRKQRNSREDEKPMTIVSYVTQLATLNVDRSTVGTQYRPLNWSKSQLTYLK